MSSRNLCFTINHPTEEDRAWVQNVACSYIVAGDEVGEEGTPHIQGYIEFKTPKRFATLKNECPRAHFEKRMGTAKQAADYCKKDGHFIERGAISKQGKRTDLEEPVADVISGVSMREIAAAHPIAYTKYYKGLERLQWRLAPDRVDPPEVVWLWGMAGTGKTRRACDCDSVYIKDNTQWWDGYEFQRRIVIDDFDKGCWPFRDLLRLLDRYPYQGQTKGGYIKINSPEIYITCEWAPDQGGWSIGNELNQILRRITRIEEVIAPM